MMPAVHGWRMKNPQDGLKISGQYRAKALGLEPDGLRSSPNPFTFFSGGPGYSHPKLREAHHCMNRKTILENIRSSIGSESAPGKFSTTQVFCFEDGQPIPPDSWRPELYTHGDHSYERAFLFDPVMVWRIRESDGELLHCTAGAVLWRDEPDGKRYCLMRRRRYPIGCYTIPAGHVEMGETTQQSALREAFEEAGLGIISVEPFTPTRGVWEGREVMDPCRRGADLHVWHVYLCQCTGEPRLSEEGDVIGWFTREEILNDLSLHGLPPFSWANFSAKLPPTFGKADAPGPSHFRRLTPAP